MRRLMVFVLVVTVLSLMATTALAGGRGRGVSVQGGVWRTAGY